MTNRSTQHATFVIERAYDFPPEQVYAAWANPKAKASWFVGPEEWEKSDHKLDFRVGGKESVSGGPPGGPAHKYNATIYDIAPSERIVSAYEMHIDDVRISVSLATVQFKPGARGGATVVYTEQAAFLDGYDDAGSRERGTRDLLDNLEAALKRQAA